MIDNLIGVLAVASVILFLAFAALVGVIAWEEATDSDHQPAMCERIEDHGSK